MKGHVFLIFLLLIPYQAWAAEISNPQTVSYMRAEIVQNSSITLDGDADIVELDLSMPQEDQYQKIELLEISDSNGICKTEKCSYVFVYDDYGNKKVKITWKKPEGDIEFKTKYIVSVENRKSLDIVENPEFLKPTDLIQSTDKEIADLASKARGTDFEKIAFLSEWIYQNIRYDNIFSDISISAKDILRTKRGVCDEFSNLLVSLLRNLGYHSAVAVGYVYPGTIYQGENFQPHGWTEVYTGDGIVVDPTWTEVGYLDATHIKYETLPDSHWIFGNLLARGSFYLKAELGKIETKIKILDFKETPLIESESNFLDDDVWKEYAVLKTDLYADGCVLTRMNVKSCVNKAGEEILSKINENEIVYFCGRKSHFTIFKIPDDLKANMVYTCSVNALPLGGENQLVPLTISHEEINGIKMYTEKTVLTPGEQMSVSSPDSYIFTETGEYGFGKVNITAPYYDFKVYAYRLGSLMEKDVIVVSEKPFEIILSAPENVTVGKTIPVSVGVKNLRDGEQTIDVTFQGKTITENLKGLNNYIFNFTPQNSEDNLIQVFVSTLHYSGSKSKLIKVSESQEILDITVSTIQNFFVWIFETVRSIFK